MKTKLVLAIAISLAFAGCTKERHLPSAPPRNGNEVGNGGGQGEKNVLIAWERLHSSLRFCLRDRKCDLDAKEREWVEKIVDKLEHQPLKKSQLEFVSPKTHPKLFEVASLHHGTVRSALTGGKWGDKIYVNKEHLFERLDDRVLPLSPTGAIGLLFDELAHHIEPAFGISAEWHQRLDWLCVKIRKCLENFSIGGFGTLSPPLSARPGSETQPPIPAPEDNDGMHLVRRFKLPRNKFDVRFIDIFAHDFEGANNYSDHLDHRTIDQEAWVWPWGAKKPEKMKLGCADNTPEGWDGKHLRGQWSEELTLTIYFARLSRNAYVFIHNEVTEERITLLDERDLEIISPYYVPLIRAELLNVFPKAIDASGRIKLTGFRCVTGNACRTEGKEYRVKKSEFAQYGTGRVRILELEHEVGAGGADASNRLIDLFEAVGIVPNTTLDGHYREAGLQEILCTTSRCFLSTEIQSGPPQLKFK